MKTLALLSTLMFATGPLSTLSGYPEDSLHVSKIEEMKFRSQNFEIVANLYLPSRGASPYPLVIWVSGSGPSVRWVKNPETIKLVNCFLDGGVAYFRIDKPGSGDSKGTVNDDSVFAQLSTIVVDAIRELKTKRNINPSMIGLFGSSQAGYIMPKVIAARTDVAFMIGSSCPGENSIDQWNYLLEHQMQCEGASPERAKQSAEMFRVLRCTFSKSEFARAVEYFRNFPITVKSLGYDSSFSEKVRSWWPREIDTTDESYFNPISVVERTRRPLYLVYGAHDKQIDPNQAIGAYTAACKKAGNARVKIALLPNADHNMFLSNGCLSEIESMNKTGTYRIDPAYLETVRNWVEEIAGSK